MVPAPLQVLGRVQAPNLVPERRVRSSPGKAANLVSTLIPVQVQPPTRRPLALLNENLRVLKKVLPKIAEVVRGVTVDPDQDKAPREPQGVA